MLKIMQNLKALMAQILKAIYFKHSSFRKQNWAQILLLFGEAFCGVGKFLKNDQDIISVMGSKCIFIKALKLISNQYLVT